MEEKKVYNYLLVILLPLLMIIMQMLVGPGRIPDKHFSKTLFAKTPNFEPVLFNSAGNAISPSEKDSINADPTTSLAPQSPAREMGSNPMIVIYFDGTPSGIQISKAPLKYNKDFAYSFTLDDGKENAYTGAYPLFAGGYSEETGLTYPGLNYTDGCGNNIPFKGGIAINSVNGNGDDPHQGTLGSITWDQVVDLYNQNWDVFNHSYSHKYGPGTDYNAEVLNNQTYIKSKTGIDMSHFVIPSGDVEYTNYAFNAGMKAVYNQGGSFPGGNGLPVNAPVSLQNFKMYRQFLNDDNYADVSGKTDLIARQSNSQDHYWYSEFTHHVSVSKSAGGLLFPTFKQHMDNLENKYGSRGLDNMWMAPLQEVYEYLSVRELSSITNTLEEDNAFVYIDFNRVPGDLRRYAMTLLVDSDKNISKVECTSASHISFKGTGATKLINIEWTYHPLEVATGLANFADPEGMLKVYPNPVQNKLTLNFTDSNLKKVFISIYDQKGIEYNLGEHEVEHESTTIDLRKLNLIKGTYIIKASSKDGKRQFSKLILKE